MKGIILAGGNGTRLYPLTQTVNKQLLPVWDKPLIYYPLSTLMLSGIKDILIICKEEDKPNYVKLLGNGSEIGCNIEYAIQYEPNGLAQAFVIGEDFIGDDDVCLVLGDNIFYGNGLSEKLKETSESGEPTIFAYKVSNPQQFGIVEFDENNTAISIEEKPQNPKSDWCVPGLYFYTNDVIKIAKSLEPSERGEYEITDVNKVYLERCELKVEKRQNFKIACLHEIALNEGFITEETLKSFIENSQFQKSEYINYLKQILD
jgi:glucose-1-phosphate thymidylyltransferase